MVNDCPFLSSEQVTPDSDGRSGAVAPAGHPNLGANSASRCPVALVGESPRLVIRGESQQDKADGGERIEIFAKGSGKAGIRFIPLPRTTSEPYAALTDWLNVTFPFGNLGDEPIQAFMDRFSEATGCVFGGMTDQGRGKYGYSRSYALDRGKVLFAHGGQRGTALLSISGEGCAFITDWPKLIALLRDELHGRITRWDGAVDDYSGEHSVDVAVAIYTAGGFVSNGNAPSYSQKGAWLIPDGSGRTFYVGKRENGKLLRVYEKGKQLGDRSSPWVRWELELHNVDRYIPWEVLLEPGRYVGGSYPCMSWVQEEVSRIRTVKAQDAISYDRLKHVGSLAYGALINVMLAREGNAERVVQLLRREGVPRRLQFSDDYLRMERKSDED